jgi:hypothetical protein
MRFKSRYSEIEANQFLKDSECPLGVRTKEDGTHYVVTAQGQEVVVHPGEWIVIEDPPGDGTRAYPIAPDMFPCRWEPKYGYRTS